MKKYDMVVKTGEYTDRNTGETKPVWRNIGAVMQGDKGHYALIDKTFNPAGVQGDEGSVLVSLFEPKGGN